MMDKDTRLLDMVMPNGKMLRDCTGAECNEMSAAMLRGDPDALLWAAAVARMAKAKRRDGLCVPS